jgi:soluble lytic murein transglycosylase-like protein
MLRLLQSALQCVLPFLALIVISAALLVQPARAHTSYRHHLRGVAWRHREAGVERGRLAERHWRRRAYPIASAHWAVPSVNEPVYSSWQETWQENWQQESWPQNWQQQSWQRGEQGFGEAGPLQGMAEQAASANGIPVSLVDGVIRRESGGNPRAVSRGNYGLMQIRLGTARAMGYGGSASGLLDPSTNMTYAVRYLAGAYRAAGGNEARAVALYARGYRAAPRVQYAGYDEQPQREAAFSAGVYYDQIAQYAPSSSVHPVRRYRRRS